MDRQYSDYHCRLVEKNLTPEQTHHELLINLEQDSSQGNTFLRNAPLKSFAMDSALWGNGTLNFTFRANGVPASDTFRISNTTAGVLSFKIQAKPARYFAVRPNGRKIPPGEVAEVTVVRINRRLDVDVDKVRVLLARVADIPEASEREFWIQRKEALKNRSRHPDHIAAANVPVEEFHVPIIYRDLSNAPSLNDTDSSDSQLNTHRELSSTTTPSARTPTRRSRSSSGARAADTEHRARESRETTTVRTADGDTVRRTVTRAWTSVTRSRSAQ